MKAKLLTLTFVLLLCSPAFGETELGATLQKKTAQAMESKDYSLAESLTRQQLETLPPEDSILRASVMMQHGELLKHLDRSLEGLDEKQQASQMLNRYTKNCKQISDADLDIRAAALKLYERDGDGPCGYMANLQRAIKRAWFPGCKNAQSKQIKVQFNIHKNGKLSNLHVTRSNGYMDADNAALNAVQNASPFYPLPDGAPSTVTIEFTFDYKVFSKSDTASPI